MKTARSLTASLMFLPFIASAQSAGPVLTEGFFLQQMAVQPQISDPRTGLAVAQLSEYQKEVLAHVAHRYGRCGGFENLATGEDPRRALQALQWMDAINESYRRGPYRTPTLNARPEIQAALSQVSAQNLQAWVQWLSSFPSRSHRAQDPNVHVEAVRQKLQALIGLRRNVRARVNLIEHKNTRQKTVHLRIDGAVRPQEVVVLGGHLDSTSSGATAPGADDNASGSSNLIEAVATILAQPRPPERTLDFFWYAGEEGGLIGSAEIAKQYAAERVDVIGVLQLDMTMFPGSGKLVIGNVSDYTSAWLRDYFVELNRVYIGAKLIEDRCGYACSDHASWHRQGFSTLMPFESNTRNMNRDIHTIRDMISPRSDFEHSAAFTKIAIAYAMDLGNSTFREPTGRRPHFDETLVDF